MKLFLLGLILLTLTACSKPIVTPSEVEIPEVLLEIPERPEKPSAPTTNGEMYLYRLSLEHYLCELVLWSQDLVWYITNGEQELTNNDCQ